MTTAREQVAAHERLLSDLRGQEDVIAATMTSLATAEAMLAAESELTQIDGHVAAARELATEIATLEADVEQIIAALAADETMARDTMAGLAARRDGLESLQQLFQQKAETGRQENLAREALTAARERIHTYERLLSDLRGARGCDRRYRVQHGDRGGHR